MKRLQSKLVLVGIILLCFCFKVESSNAKVIQVENVKGKLQEAINAASDGDVLEYDARSFSEDEVIINKDLTIRGRGDGKKQLFARIFIRSKANGKPPTVHFENAILFNMFRSSINHSIVQIDNQAIVYFDDTMVTYGGGGSEDIDDERGMALNITANADGCIIEANNSEFTGYLDGVRIASSNNLITFKNTYIAGQLALAIASPDESSSKETGNSVKLWDSTVLGYAGNDAEAAISIRGQDGLRLELDGTKLYNSFMLNGSSAATKAHLIYFNQTITNQNVQISIKGNSILEDTLQQVDSSGHFTNHTYDGSGYVFNFGNNNLPADNNVVQIEGSVKIHPNDMAHKYNTNSSYIVVGIYDQEGNGEIKTYSNSTSFEERLTSMEANIQKLSQYRFEEWQTNYASPTTFDKRTSVSTNADIFPKVIRIYRVRIGSDTFYVDENSTLGSLDPTSLQKLRSYKEEGSLDKQFWHFVGKDESGNEQIIDEDTPITKDLTLTPKFQVQVTFFNDPRPFTLELGKTLQDLPEEEASRLEGLKEQANKHFTHFDGVYTDHSTAEVSLDTPIMKNVTITPKYEVWVMVLDEKIVLPEGATLQSIQEEEAYQSIFKPSNKNFVGFQDFSLDTPIFEDQSLIPQYTVDVFINTERFVLPEGGCLDDLENDESQKDRYLALREPTNKIFASISSNPEMTFQTPITEHTHLTFSYQVKVHVKGEKVEHTFYLDEGSNLDSLSGNETYEALLHPDHKTFDSFLHDGEDFDTSRAITENIELSILYHVTVTINGESFTLPEKGKLTDFALDARYQELISPSNKEFWQFQKDGVLFLEDTEIYEDTTLTALYHVLVTIEGTTLRLVEGEVLADYVSDPMYQQAISKEKKIFHKLVHEDGSDFDMNQPIHENVTLHGTYFVRVVIAGKSFQLDENQTLKDLESNSLYYQIRYPDDKQFWKFVNGEDEFLETTPITEELHLDVLYQVLVKIDSLEFTLLEGQCLDDLKGNENYDAIFSTSQKDFRGFLENGKDFSVTSPIHQNTTLTTHYQVQVTIDGTLFVVDEGKTIQELYENEDFQKIVNPTHKEFYNFYLGDEVFDEATPFYQHTTLHAKYYVCVTILDSVFKMEEGSSLLTFQHDSMYQAIKSVDGKDFQMFTLNGREVLEDEPIYQNVTLEPVYTIQVTILDTRYELFDGESLLDLNDDGLLALETLKHQSDRPFARFVLSDGSEIAMDQALHHHVTISAEYQLKVTVDGYDFYLNAGDSLEDLSASDWQILESLRAQNKVFDHYVDEYGEVFHVTDAISSDLQLTSTYHVLVSILDYTFEIGEGETIESLKNEEDYEKIIHPTEKSFWKFMINGEDFDEKSELHENIRLVPIYQISVTVDEKTYLLEEGKCLNDLEEDGKNYFTSLKEKENFSRFVNEAGDTLEMDQALYKNVMISAKYLVKVTLNQEEFFLEEGNTLESLSNEDQERMKASLQIPEGMVFDHFVNAKNDEVIDASTPIYEDLVLKPIFLLEEIKEEETSTPVTFDAIVTFLLSGLAGLCGIGGGVFWYRKAKKTM